MQTSQQQNTTGQSATNSLTGVNNQTAATANPAVANAATGNLNFVQGLQDKGFQGYQGPQVAAIDQNQQSTINNAYNVANNGTGAQAAGLINQYAGAGPQSVTAGTVTPQTTASQMSPYMSQYVMQALAPQLQQMDNANARTNQMTDALATSHGGYGDARTGIEQSNNMFNQNVAREGVIGNAYNSAFNTAITAGAGDANRNLQGQTTNVSNSLDAQKSNAAYNEQALARALGGSQALQGLQNQQLGADTAANALTQQDTANNQAQLTANYNQWLLSQQYPFQTAGLVNSTVAQAANAMPATTNNNTQTWNGTSVSQQGTGQTQQPNNSGWGALGTIAGIAAAPFTGGLSLGLTGASLGSMFGGSGGPITYGTPNGPTAFSNVAV